jgi:hypothetical protein
MTMGRQPRMCDTRTGTRRYTERPPANCRKARAVWDIFAEDGPALWIHLGDGYWGCCREEDGNIEQIENLPYLAERKS